MQGRLLGRWLAAGSFLEAAVRPSGDGWLGESPADPRPQDVMMDDRGGLFDFP